MARPRKRPDYNPDKLTKKLIDMMSEDYLNPVEGNIDSEGHRLLKELAEDYDMTPIKVRKLLVTAGIYETDTSIMINELYDKGKSVNEIHKITGLSLSSISGYLPYRKTVYNLSERSVLAERLRLYRRRKDAVERLKRYIKDNNIESKIVLWNTLILFEKYLFRTVRGNKFYYKIKGDEIFVDRKDKSITRATIDYAYDKVMKLQGEGVAITGPKTIGCFGDSYIYPVFIRLGIIENKI